MCSTQLRVHKSLYKLLSAVLAFSSNHICHGYLFFLISLFSLVEKSSEMKNRLQKASKTKWPWKSGRRCLKWAKIRTFITICVPASSPLSMVRVQLLLQRKEISPVKILVLINVFVVPFWEFMKAQYQLSQTLPSRIGFARKGRPNSQRLHLLN